MKIGIIGAGMIGGTLVRRLSEARHQVKVANSRGPETISQELLTAGARAVTSSEVVLDVDVLVLSVPLDRIPALAALVSSLPADTVVIDTSNYMPYRMDRIDAIESGQPHSVWVSRQLSRPIVKAWNSIGSDSFARKPLPRGAEGRIALPVAADRDSDRAVGIALVEDTGFDGYDAGPLAESWRQHPAAPAYCTDLTKAQLPAALASAEFDRLQPRSELMQSIIVERFGRDVSTVDTEWVTQLARLVYM